MKYRWTLFFISAVSLLNATTIVHSGIVTRMPTLVMQLGLIIFAARFGAILLEKIHLPGVLGELLIGVLIGPYLLGAIPVIGFPHGFFAVTDPGFPIQPELYGIAVIASIILLFLSGLETDLNLFIKYSFAGTMVGIGGILFSFFIGAYTGMLFMHLPLSDPKCLFLGIMSTATSVGITARILSERKKMDTPEGVTIIAAAVIDDVVGVILLAIVLGISLQMTDNKTAVLNWSKIGLIAFKEIGIWLGVTALGLYFAKRIGRFLKIFKDRYLISIMAFSIALVVAGLFERVGLAMIIGAYVVGLTLSKTDISFTIQEAMHPLRVFFVPVFFTIMGMLVDVRALIHPATMIFGLVYTLGAVLSKFLGCGIPALFLNFNLQGAKRIGLGMIPRGEVALIIAGIGLSYGLLNDPNYDIFGIAIVMTLISTFVSPPLLNYELMKEKKGIRNKADMPDKETLQYTFDDNELAELMAHKVVTQFQSMGFNAIQVNPEAMHYNLRRHSTNISLIHEPNRISLQTDSENAMFTRRMVHEAAFFLNQSVNSILSMDDIARIKPDSKITKTTLNTELMYLLKEEDIIPRIQSGTKEGVVRELLDVLVKSKKLTDADSMCRIVMTREKYLSGGLVYGLAIPHAHTNAVSKPTVALGIKHDGMDFKSIDKKPTYIIFLILTPEKDASAHIRLLAGITRLSHQPKRMFEIIEMSDAAQIRKAILDAIYNEV